MYEVYDTKSEEYGTIVAIFEAPSVRSRSLFLVFSFIDIYLSVVFDVGYLCWSVV